MTENFLNKRVAIKEASKLNKKIEVKNVNIRSGGQYFSDSIYH